MPMEFGNLKDFKQLRGYLEKCLMDENELLSFNHSAVACNLAEQISAISYLLNSPRSNIACAHLQGVVLVQLDIFRETLREITQSSNTYQETTAEKSLRSWSGYIKHPSGTAFAHACFAEFELANEIKIDTDYLLSISNMRAQKRDNLKNELQNKIVTIEYPNRLLIEEFLSDCEVRIRRIITHETPATLRNRVQARLSEE